MTLQIWNLTKIEQNNVNTILKPNKNATRECSKLLLII
jgi:hypothetical protein